MEVSEHLLFCSCLLISQHFPLDTSTQTLNFCSFMEAEKEAHGDTIPYALPFQLGPSRMAPEKKGGEKDHSAINIHKCIHGVDFKKHAPQALKEIWKFAMKEMGTPGVCIDTRLNKTIWAKGIRNVSYHIQVHLFVQKM
jgi:large subunit ribosomal protein L31e